MYNSLTGRISAKRVDSLHLSLSGVEWDLQVSQNCLIRIGHEGEEARVFTYLHHKEDVLQLYGFFSERERELFLSLVTVSGVGPKLALKILSAMELPALVGAIETENIEALSKISGLGKKTAQKIILQLQGKLVTESESRQPGVLNEIVESLVAMGYDKTVVTKVVQGLMLDSQLLKLPPEEREKEVIRRAIVEISSPFA